jgi:hypothetical protein
MLLEHGEVAAHPRFATAWLSEVAVSSTKRCKPWRMS